jgi:pyruvate/2-oxoglutarate/acetoin dehydrogenase E1 component/TPP-dependent pyruvate/acetoin dehydrogenase alpha subunit
MNTSATLVKDEALSFETFTQQVLQDYRVAVESREVSLLGRKEVLTGKAKFGIFGDGVEVAQVAMARFFQNGDYRSGYYRDQTFMFAAGLATVEQFFAQLYADPDVKNDPFSAGRQMNAHFSTPNTNARGEWLDLANHKNISSDMAPTAGQMPRAVGLAFASKAFRNIEALKQRTDLSDNGNEICFCTIGDSSTSEGHFWETMNAAAVLQVPLAVFVWDNGYGISVPKKYQTVKESISEALKGFQKKDNTNGLHIYKVKAWDYAGMCEVFEQAIAEMRITHIPAIFHVEEVTQPQGHSTSGSHERYKTKERLEWERQWDGLKKMREWILENELATEQVLDDLEINAKEYVKQSKQAAWDKYLSPIKKQVGETDHLLQQLISNGADLNGQLAQLSSALLANREPLRRDVMKTLATAVAATRGQAAAQALQAYYRHLKKENYVLYNTYLHNEHEKSALRVAEVAPEIPADAPHINGFEVLNKYFDQLFANNPSVLAFGEDLGYIGDVNQGFSGLQEKYGADRIFDTGIRELTIMGQGIGLALRGLRPIAEIQYLDYLLYGLQPLSDDVASLHYRTKGQQSCPLIVRTRGHRLEGIWHSGSPMGMILNALRGIYVCVPRNMVQAAGMYNTLLQANDPALVIECLNGYRLKEALPANLATMTVPLGVPEVIRPGTDITLVGYGSTLRIIMDAASQLIQEGIDCEVVDVQTLLPFDIHHHILASLKKTSRILFVDEDVPGGAAAFMYNQVMELQGGYRWVDAAPRTLTAQAHRPAYGSDGDYFSKPNTEDVMEAVRELMAE